MQNQPHTCPDTNHDPLLVYVTNAHSARFLVIIMICRQVYMSARSLALCQSPPKTHARFHTIDVEEDKAAIATATPAP